MAERTQTTEKPPHPLVVDRHTGLCRYATDADIRRMERVCAAYDRLVSDLRWKVELADELEKIING